ncbi:DUF4493 domain-containing protein [Parabacteroides distasonis]|uniref:DUF4493 domain-containing protein n=1 Tax=Parabacteroides distasonis TaxID=823 RepID=UPI001D0F58BC|nr:DUF4493 domain-containing protein [Parabacteroides distasonis]MCC2780911.1 DUF4493 domain-containing protein [Parabacteroides distasonis]MCQ5182177.1 DUF4493 domain-containing protein [Parabacteroides distasonis]
MKGNFLLGLITAFALFSSCSNILEDSGNSLATAKTGKLGLALEADASVCVTTKATSTTSVTISDEVKNNLVITGTKDGSPITLGKSSDFTNGATKAVPAGTYTELSATYDQMSGDLQFDSPTLAGKTTESVTITPNAAAASASITATLTNSIITINTEEFAKLQKMATITKLYVYTGTADDPTEENPEYTLLSTANTLETGKTLFVKPGLSNVFIRIEGKLIADETKIFSISSQIRESEETSITAATKNYSVQYSLANTQGTLTLTINVNGTVEIVEIPVEVNPYE